MITIIGAGLTGLSLAYHLQQAGLPYLLLEGTDEAGGYMKTVKINDCILELGPNSILADEELVGFFKNLGIEKELLPANEVSKARYIFKEGRYRQLPENPIKLLLGNFFSLSARLKIFREPFAPAVEKEDETLEEFFTRRFGKEVNDYALTPFITGIYAGDPKEILIEESFPILKEYERKYGSVLKGFIKNKPGRKQSYNFKGGMQSLPSAMAKKLQSIKYNSRVLSIKKQGKELLLKVQSGAEVQELKSDTLIFTTPAFAALTALKDLYPDFSKALEKIYYPPVAVVHSIYDRSKVGHTLNGFGALNPKVENMFSSGCIWTSSVFSGRCPSDKVLFTSFVGGAMNPDKANMQEAEIKEKVHEELKSHYSISGSPYFQHFFKWNRSIPQYTKDLKKAKEYLKDVETDNIFFCTNWTNGVSLSDSIKKGKQLAEKIIKLQSL